MSGEAPSPDAIVDVGDGSPATFSLYDRGFVSALSAFRPDAVQLPPAHPDCIMVDLDSPLGSDGAVARAWVPASPLPFDADLLLARFSDDGALSRRSSLWSGDSAPITAASGGIAIDPDPEQAGVVVPDRPGAADLQVPSPGPSHGRYTTRIACAACARSKVRCDRDRPCLRCRIQGKADTCVDRPRKRRRPSSRDPPPPPL